MAFFSCRFSGEVRPFSIPGSVHVHRKDSILFDLRLYHDESYVGRLTHDAEYLMPSGFLRGSHHVSIWIYDLRRDDHGHDVGVHEPHGPPPVLQLSNLP